MSVYVPQSPLYKNTAGKLVPKFDIRPARKFGNPVELLSPNAKPFDLGPIIEELYEKLETFNETDYIICIGNPIILATTVAVASDVSNGRVRMLQWHGRRKEYIPVEMDLGFTSDAE